VCIMLHLCLSILSVYSLLVGTCSDKIVRGFKWDNTSQTIEVFCKYFDVVVKQHWNQAIITPDNTLILGGNHQLLAGYTALLFIVTYHSASANNDQHKIYIWESSNGRLVCVLEESRGSVLDISVLG
jgi:hypothetical protein